MNEETNQPPNNGAKDNSNFAERMKAAAAISTEAAQNPKIITSHNPIGFKEAAAKTSGSKPYHVYEHPTLGFDAVSTGFSWAAFFCNWIWAFYRKLWTMGFVVFALLGLSIYLDIVIEEEMYDGEIGTWKMILAIGVLGLFVVCGLIGNSQKMSNLIKRGYLSVGTVNAMSPDHAIAVYVRGKSEGD